MSVEQIEDYISDRLNKKSDQITGCRHPQNVRKIDIRRNPQSAQINSLKIKVSIDKQIINMTIDTGSPGLFLNWAAIRQTLEGCPKTKFIPTEKLKLSAQFFYYN